VISPGTQTSASYSPAIYGAYRIDTGLMTNRKTVVRRLVLLLAFSCSLQAQVKPTHTFELASVGFPAESKEGDSYKTCPYEYVGYRAVRWLDDERVVLAFSTTPWCSMIAGPRSGTLKLVTMNMQGRMLHSTTVEYDAGDGQSSPLTNHDSVWVGPAQTVLVDERGLHLKGHPKANGKLLVFSQELESLQEIDTGDHEAMGDGNYFEGVSQDRAALLFSTSDPAERKQRRCLLYTGAPLRQTGKCSLGELDAMRSPHPLGRAIVGKNYQVAVDVGSSRDGARSSIIILKNESSVCVMSGKLCPKSGKVVVFETATSRLLFRNSLPRSGRAALSPDGRRVAILDKGRLEIFELP